MATYNKFNVFVQQLTNKQLDLFGTGGTADSVFCMLSNTQPVVTNAVKTDITQIANGNGYTTDGASATPNGTRSGGTMTLAGTSIVWTCVTAPMGPFQFVVLYDNTTGDLIDWWDYGSAITLQVGDTFTVNFNGGNPTGTIFTLV